MKQWLYRLYIRVWRRFHKWFSVDGHGHIITPWTAEVQLRAIWPNIKVSSPDRSLIVLPFAELEKDIKSFPYWLYKWISELFDCDDYALCLHAHMRICRLKKYLSGGVPAGQVFPAAFEQIWGSEMMSVKSPHAVCVMIAQEGVFVIEPQTGKIEKVDPGRDKAWEVRF